jgi:serine/threonine protein phosphatase PrpC
MKELQQVRREGEQHVHETELHDLGRGQIRFAAVSQRGYYPDEPDRVNQDSYGIQLSLAEADMQSCWFAVFDGHGSNGHDASKFAKSTVLKELQHKIREGEGIDAALSAAFAETNQQLNKGEAGNMHDSGTTAICVLIHNGELIVANVGDSRAMLGSTVTGHSTKPLVATGLSEDQTPYRRDERERVRKAGAAVMVDEGEDLKPYDDKCDIELGKDLDENDEPPRLFYPGSGYPGVAFTRALGDTGAEGIGVICEPEIKHHLLTPADRIILIASDGVFEFIRTQECIDIAARFEDPLEASKALVAEAYNRWKEKLKRTDDITVITIFYNEYLSQLKGA